MDKPNSEHDSLVVFETGEFFFCQGEKIDTAFLIKEGSVDLLSQTEDGVTLLTETIGSSNIIGMVAACHGLPLTYSAQVREETTVRLIPRHVLEKMLNYEERDKPITEARASDQTLVEHLRRQVQMYRQRSQLHQSLARQLMFELWIVQRTLVAMDAHCTKLIDDKKTMENNASFFKTKCVRFEKEIDDLRELLSAEAGLILPNRAVSKP